MKLKVELWYEGGVVEDGSEEPAEPRYDLVDADNGGLLADRRFRSYEDLEQYISEHYPGVERWSPPLAPADEAEKIERLLDLLERPDRPLTGSLKAVRNALISPLYEWSLPPETAARIRAVLSRTGLRNTLR